MEINIEEICEKLQSKERGPKIAALCELTRYCKSSGTKSFEVLSTFDECYLYLLKCYSDRYESVRDCAAQTVNVFIERLPVTDFHLANIICTLVERMGQQETVEDSEEIRLIYIIQLHGLVRHYLSIGSGEALHECYADFVKILVKGIRDSYPSVQRESCACVVSIAKSAETYVFQQWCDQLAIALYTMLNHKHSLARISAIEALAQVALHVNASGDALSRLLMEVSPLLMDQMPLVRRECGKFGVLLLLELRDRYSYFDRIIPLVLCCLKDDLPEVVEYIRPLWWKCGSQYYDENETELSKQDLGDVLPENYPVGVERPTIGCRGLVQRSLRLLKLITRESSDWKENVRLHSLKLLYQFVLHAEAAMTAKFFEIYNDVAAACKDIDETVANEAFKVSDLMGRLFSYHDWFDHGFKGFTKFCSIGHLICFYYMFTATLGGNKNDICKISTELKKSKYSQSLKPQFQIYVIKFMETLLVKFSLLDTKEENPIEVQMENLDIDGDDVDELIIKNIYVSTIKVMALALDSEIAEVADLQEKGNKIISKIANREGLTVAKIHEEYFGAALQDVQNLDAPLDGQSEPILLLHGLIKIGKFRQSYLNALQEHINEVFSCGLDDAQVKILSAVSISMLNWDESIARDTEENAELLRQFLCNVVEKNLVWRAGANAEVMRSLATATLSAAAQGAELEAQQVLPIFAKYMPSLLEDHSVATRHYAVKCMFNFGQLKIQELKPIAYAILQRLDDPSAGIRELAVKVIPYFSPDFESSTDAEKKPEFERGIWDIYIAKVFDMLFLHYEGPELRLKTAIKDTVGKLAQVYPEICKDSFIRTKALSYASSSLIELKDVLPFPV